MLTFTGQQELAQDLSSDSNSTNLELFKNLINIGIHKVERRLEIFVREKEKTYTTRTDSLSGSNYQDYQLPRGFVSLNDVYVTVGTTQYRAELIEDPAWWGRITGSTTQTTSDFLKYVRIKGRKLQLWPIPSSANTLTLNYFGSSKDLSQDDYVTGTILTLANAGTAVTGTDTVWTDQMVGRVFKVNADAEWHYIKSRASATSITLETPYQGAAIAAGTEAYTIGEVCSLPEDIHDLPVKYALWQFFAFYHRDKFLASMYKNEWNEGLENAEMEYSSAGSSVIIQGQTDMSRHTINANWWPTGMS